MSELPKGRDSASQGGRRKIYNLPGLGLAYGLIAGLVIGGVVMLIEGETILNAAAWPAVGAPVGMAVGALLERRRVRRRVRKP